MLLFKNVCWGLLHSRSVPGSSDTKGNRTRFLPLSSMFCWTVNSSQQRSDFFLFVHHCSLITDHCCLKQKLSLKWVETPAGWGRGGWSPHRSSSEKIEERTHFRDIPELRHHLWNRKDNGENTDRMNKSYRHVVRRLDSSSKFFTYYYYWAHDWVVRHLSREDGCGSQIQKSQVFRKI